MMTHETNDGERGLAESLAEAIEWFVIDQFGMVERSHDIAAAILAMPEMQTFHALVVAIGESTWENAPLLDKAWDNLPMSVYHWAYDAT